MTTEPIAVATNHVYLNAAGKQRLVVEVSHSLSARLYSSWRGRQPDSVVNWSTADPKLPARAKAQGSATLRSFQRWAYLRCSASSWAAVVSQPRAMTPASPRELSTAR